MNTRALQRRATGIARDPAFMMGFRAVLGTMLGIGAWGMVTGVAMVKAGMSVPLAIFTSLVVYAGSAQLAVLPLHDYSSGNSKATNSLNNQEFDRSGGYVLTCPYCGSESIYETGGHYRCAECGSNIYDPDDLELTALCVS